MEDQITPIRTLDDLAQFLGVDPGKDTGVTANRIDRRVHKDYSCGPWFEYEAVSLVRSAPRFRFGTIVEGSDATFETGWITFPVSGEAIRIALTRIDREAAEAWDNANRAEGIY